MTVRKSIFLLFFLSLSAIGLEVNQSVRLASWVPAKGTWVQFNIEGTSTACTFEGIDGAGPEFRVKGFGNVSVLLRETSMTTKQFIYRIEGNGDFTHFRAPEMWGRALTFEADRVWRICKKGHNSQTCAASTQANILNQFHVTQTILEDDEGKVVHLVCGVPYQFSQWFPKGYLLPKTGEIEKVFGIKRDWVKK